MRRQLVEALPGYRDDVSDAAETRHEARDCRPRHAQELGGAWFTLALDQAAQHLAVPRRERDPLGGEWPAGSGDSFVWV
ncbi:MAG: hypothetical protein KA712_16865 [Myxococcales bacterium]|nr:hypothetical protein [Myxococcales bacterium]